eukprot:1450816-Alexandrium_andersonii.AAC.1
MMLPILLLQEAERVGAPVETLFLRPGSLLDAAARAPLRGHIDQRDPMALPDIVLRGFEHVHGPDAHSQRAIRLAVPPRHGLPPVDNARPWRRVR